MASLASSLIANGYNVVPVSDKGLPLVKITCPDTGQPLTFTQTDVESWGNKFGDISLGLMPGLCGVAILDVDITHAPLANALMRFVQNKYPSMPVRNCNPPKFALMFRTDETLEEVGNGWADQYVIPDGETQWIEYAGWNKVVTIKGVHRSTGNKYSWGEALDPERLLAAELPIITRADVDEIFKVFHTTVKTQFPHWEQVLRAKYTSRGMGAISGLAGASSTKVHTDAAVEKILEDADGASRMGWISVGRALHENYRGSAVGLGQWDLWSQQWDSYEQGACAIEWAKFVAGKGTTLDTIKSDVEWDKKAPPDALAHAIAHLVLINVGSLVGDLDAHAGENLLQLVDFKNAYANKLTMVPDAKGKPTARPVAGEWMTAGDRKMVHAQSYAPGKGQICVAMDSARSKQYWNTYIKPQWEIGPIDPAHMKVFMDHVDYLFGDEVGAVDWIINWLAQMVQMPWDRGSVAPVHISTFTGTGRGWFSSFIMRLVGESNTSESNISKMCAEGAKNGYLADTVFCVVPEVRQGGAARFSVSEALKKQITDTHLNVDIKYGSEGLMKIYTRFFFQSNHRDALVIDENDRRFNVFANHKPPKPISYYKALYDFEEDPLFAQSIFSYLSGLPVDGDKILQIMPTDARNDMINQSKSPVAKAYKVFKDLVDVFSDDMVAEFFDTYTSNRPQAFAGMKNDYSNEIRHLHTEYTKFECEIEMPIAGGLIRDTVVWAFTTMPAKSEIPDALAKSQDTLNNYCKMRGF